MKIHEKKTADTLKVELSGSFTFSDNQEFRELLKRINEKPDQKVIFELSRLEFVDSAALGMLLLLRDASETKGIKIELHNPQGQTKKMFDLSNFSALFSIHYDDE